MKILISFFSLKKRSLKKLPMFVFRNICKLLFQMTLSPFSWQISRNALRNLEKNELFVHVRHLSSFYLDFSILDL